MDPSHESGDVESRWDSGGTVAALSFVWFLAGMLLFGFFALFAFMLNPFMTNGFFEPEGYRVAVLIWHLPMAYGWVRAAYRTLRRKGRPWRHAKMTIILGALVGPILFLIVVFVWRHLLQTSASI